MSAEERTFFCGLWYEIHMKSHTRRAAEDRTPLYGEAAQRCMRLEKDCYTADCQTKCNACSKYTS